MTTAAIELGQNWTAAPDRESAGLVVAVVAVKGPVLVAAICGRTETFCSATSCSNEHRTFHSYDSHHKTSTSPSGAGVQF